LLDDRVRVNEYKKASVLVYCFAIDNRASFVSLKERWHADESLQGIIAANPQQHVPKVLCGMKYRTELDCGTMSGDASAIARPSVNAVQREEAVAVAKELGCVTYVETNAKDNYNVDLALRIFIEASLMPQKLTAAMAAASSDCGDNVNNNFNSKLLHKEIMTIQQQQHGKGGNNSKCNVQ